MAAVLHITNQMVDALLQNPTLIAAFPACLANRVQQVAVQKCRRCPAARAGTTVDYDAVRDCIGNLPPAAKVRLKALLGAAQIRLPTRRDGRRVELVF